MTEMDKQAADEIAAANDAGYAAFLRQDYAEALRQFERSDAMGSTYAAGALGVLHPPRPGHRQES